MLVKNKRMVLAARLETGVSKNRAITDRQPKTEIHMRRFVLLSGQPQKAGDEPPPMVKEKGFR